MKGLLVIREFLRSRLVEHIFVNTPIYILFAYFTCVTRNSGQLAHQETILILYLKNSFAFH